MPYTDSFPTEDHRRAAEAVVDFAKRSTAQAVVVVNSCARGTAVPESDLDMALLVAPTLSSAERQSLEQAWRICYETLPVFRQLERRGRFARVHLDLFDGNWVPLKWDDGGGPDSFEIEIGNLVVHAAPLWERGTAFADLGRVWLPYYGEDLRRERLAMVKESCQLNLERVCFCVGRHLYFQAFDRLYHAFQELHQAVFIARGVYPISYNKWIREQVEGWLGLPDLYAELPGVLEVRQLESEELNEKARHLLQLLETWTSLPGKAQPGLAGFIAKPLCP